MYKKIYRQEGGLAEEGLRAQIREASRKAIEDWNRRTKGEVAAKVRTPRRSLKVMYHGTTPEAAKLIRQTGFEGGKVPTWAGKGKVFVTPNIDVAKRYPTTGPADIVKTVVPKSSPHIIGGGIGQGGISIGKEYALKPDAANKAKDLYETALKKYETSPTAKKLIDTGKIDQVITPKGGLPSILKTVGKKLGQSIPFVGTGLSINDAIARYKAGDYSGAVLSTLSAVPGFGIPATVAQLGTDYLGITGADKDEGGLASLPEAQADEPWYTEDWDTFVSKRREDPDTDLQYIGPEVQTVDTYKDKIYPQISFKDLPPNYQEYINNLPPNQQRSELAKIPPGHMPKPTYVKDKGWGYTEFDPFYEIPYYREFYNVPSREDIISAGQPVEQLGSPIVSPSPDLFNRPVMPEGFVPPPEVPGVQPQAIPLGFPNKQGFKSKESAMAHARENPNQQQGLVNVYQLPDGSWDYQRVDRGPTPLGLLGGPAI